MAESIVKLSVEDSSFNAHIKRAAKEFADFGKRVADVGVDSFVKFAKGTDTAKVAFQNFNKALKANALVFVASLAIEAGQAIGEMIGDWISGANDAEEAQKRLNEELERTAQAIDEINSVSDFNARIAKAAGASTTEILKMKYEAADLAYNTAMATLMDPALKVGTEEYDKAKKMLDEAEKRRKKAWEDIKVDETARQYHTGEYAPRSSGRTRTKKEKPGIIVGPMPFAEGVMYDSSIEMTERLKNAVINIKSPMQALTEEMKNLQEAQMKALSPEEWELYQQEIERVQGEMAKFRGENKAGAKGTKESWKDAAAAMESVGSALASIEDPSAKIAGLIGQAIANIALGFAQATASDSKLGVFGWIAAIAGGMATMLSTISAIHSATGYAQGGIIPGNNYSGDTQWARVNSGELILNRSQQANLANQLSEGSPFRNMVLTATLSGEDLRLAINRNGKRTGRGEIVTTGFKMQ